MAISEEALRLWEKAKAEAPRPVRVINERLGDPVIDDSLAALYETIAALERDNPLEDYEGGSWMPEDGLKEGRDFEYV